MADPIEPSEPSQLPEANVDPQSQPAQAEPQQPEAEPEQLTAEQALLSHPAQPKVRKGKRVYSTDPDTKKFGFRVTHALYEAMWEAYRDGKRSILEIRLLFGVGEQTAATVVNRGYPQKGWIGLKERAKRHDLQVQTAAQKEAAAEALKRSDVWQRAKDENLKYLKVARAATVYVMQKAVEAAQTAKFTRTRKTLDKNEVL